MGYVGIVGRATNSFNSVAEMMCVTNDGKALNFSNFLQPPVALHLLKSCLDGGTEVRALLLVGTTRWVVCHRLVRNVLHGD